MISLLDFSGLIAQIKTGEEQGSPVGQLMISLLDFSGLIAQIKTGEEQGSPVT
jgi:hypothetical protein